MMDPLDALNITHIAIILLMVAAFVMWTLPAADGTVGQMLATGGAAAEPDPLDLSRRFGPGAGGATRPQPSWPCGKRGV